MSGNTNLRGLIFITILVATAALVVMGLTLYLDFMDMTVWSSIHHHTARGKVVSGFLTLCLIVWNLAQLSWIAAIVEFV